MNDPVLYPISEIDGVFADAFVTDEENNLLFLSVWGRDTALQEFIARLTLPGHERGITDFKINGVEQNHYVKIHSANLLDKISARSENKYYQELSHVWVFDKAMTQPDLENRRVYQLYCGECPDPWPLVKSVCPVPLLDDWRDNVMQEFESRGWVDYMPLNKGDRIRAMRVDLSDPDVEAIISDMVKNGRLVA